MAVEQLSLEHLNPATDPVIGAQARIEGRTVDLSDSTNGIDITDSAVDALSPRDRRILALERQWFCNAGSKEAEISRQFGMTPTRYFQILNGLIDDPRAMREYPQVVARLRRLRLARRRTRRAHRQVVRI